MMIKSRISYAQKKEGACLDAVYAQAPDQPDFDFLLGHDDNNMWLKSLFRMTIIVPKSMFGVEMLIFLDFFGIFALCNRIWL